MSSSRLLNRLEADIAAATDPIAADCLRAERASYLARQGRFDEARAVLKDLHERYDTRPVGSLSALLNFAESMCSHFENMSQVAWDKMKRSNALSKAIGFAPLSALSSAWLAYFDFLRMDIDGLIRNLKESFANGQGMGISAKARASLVIAQSFHLAGDYEAASPWYVHTRNFAASEGDELMTSALMHNMAWIRATNLRQARLTGRESVDGMKHALLSAESVMNFDSVIQLNSLTTLVPMLRAQIFALCGRCEEALSLYRKLAATANDEGQSRLTSWIFADQAWCSAELGLTKDALEFATQSASAITSATHFDDRAATYSRLAQTYALVGDNELAEKCEKLAAVDWVAYVEHQKRFLSGLKLAAFSLSA